MGLQYSEKVHSNGKIVLQNLIDSDFLPNFEKSIFIPTKTLDWLGFTWNLEDGFIEVPKKKIYKIQTKIEKIILEHCTTARNLASVLGKIISLIPAFGNICQLMTRHLCMCVCERNSWDIPLVIPTSVRTELKFWLTNCKSIPNKMVSPIQRKPEHIIFSDTSAYAGAGFIDESILKVAHFMFTEDEKLKSSTWRELKTVLFILQSLQSIIFILINHIQRYREDINIHITNTE